MSTVFILNAPLAESDAPGIHGLQMRLLETMGGEEQKITEVIEAALDPSGPLMSLPRPVVEQFRRWENQAGSMSPEEAWLFQVIKNKIIEIHEDNRNYIRNKVASNADKIRLELSIKAISKVINGVQQLLTSQ